MKPLNLNRREKYYLTIAAGVIGIFLFLQLIVFPISDKRNLLGRMRSEKTEQLVEIRSLQSEYRALEKSAQRTKMELAHRETNFSPISYLDGLAEEVDIKNNVTRMETSAAKVVAGVKIVTVELKIETITTAQLANYLYRVEYSGNNLFVKRMSVSETSKPKGYINVVLQVETAES